MEKSRKVIASRMPKAGTECASISCLYEALLSDTVLQPEDMLVVRSSAERSMRMVVADVANMNDPVGGPMFANQGTRVDAVYVVDTSAHGVNFDDSQTHVEQCEREREC
jgi:hypothetical protein